MLSPVPPHGPLPYGPLRFPTIPCGPVPSLAILHNSRLSSACSWRPLSSPDFLLYPENICLTIKSLPFGLAGLLGSWETGSRLLGVSQFCGPFIQFSLPPAVLYVYSSLARPEVVTGPNLLSALYFMVINIRILLE